MKRIDASLKKPAILFAREIIGSNDQTLIVYPSFWRKKGFIVKGFSKNGFRSLQNTTFVQGVTGKITNRKKTCLVSFPKPYSNGNLLIRVSRHLFMNDGRKTLNRHRVHARYAFVVRKP